MGINFAPKWTEDPASKEEIAAAFDLSRMCEGDDGKSRLPRGWWILPGAIAGLIECYFAIGWIFAHL
jgi:hypothetical protein